MPEAQRQPAFRPLRRWKIELPHRHEIHAPSLPRGSPEAIRQMAERTGDINPPWPGGGAKVSGDAKYRWKGCGGLVDGDMITRVFTRLPRCRLPIVLAPLRQIRLKQYPITCPHNIALRAFLFRREKLGMGAGIRSRCAGFVAATGLILTLLSPHAVATPNDDAFNACLQALQQSQFKLTNEPWCSSRLPNDIDKIERPTLYGSIIVRWTDHKNQNGSTTYVVLTRDPDPNDLLSDPDGFDVFFKQGNMVLFKDGVAANAFAFSATKRSGVNGLLFCTDDAIFPVWNWTGSDWNP